MAEATGRLPEDLEAVRDALCAWYAEHRRPFAWRETDDPWQLLVLEVMSQQTQLERASEAWAAFVDRWPTPEALADESRAAVVSFWSDHRLGYNRRAGYLHAAATQVVDEHDGLVPEDPTTLETLPGVGPYTANAVANVAYGTGGPVVDTNVKRVLYRAFAIPDDDAAFEAAAAALHPDGDGRTWTNAIMELGGLACTSTPACDEASCPWRRWCHAYATGDFTAPDVPEQPPFEGSRRQMRGRAIAALGEHGPLALDDLGPRVRVDYSPEGTAGRAWLRELLDDLADDGLVEVVEGGNGTVARLRE
ncbi:MAG: A/G-specific adenine glycosylase [Halobacteriales archaeon]